MKTKISAEIVAHSVNLHGDEIISVLATFPRIILAEVNTHRMLSKNTSSSRAIPFAKMVETIKEDPFIPIAWQEDHKGMQGAKYLHPAFAMQAKSEWVMARNYAISMAEQMNKSTHVTKQLVNRLLEPFMWTTMLITGPKSGWDNFFNLRCPQYTLNNDDIFKSKKDFKDFYKEATEVVENHLALPLFAEDADTIAWLKANKGQAEIHIMALAECIWDAVNESDPKVLEAGEWHIPFQNTFDISELSKVTKKLKIPVLHWKDGEMVKVWISTAMSARTSYTLVGGEKGIDYEKMIALHDRLLAQDPPHSSPLEHCARAMNEIEYTAAHSTGLSRKSSKGSEAYGWCNNLKGFIPYRYIIDNSLSL